MYWASALPMEVGEGGEFDAGGLGSIKQTV